jgi:hypothetical protein
MKNIKGPALKVAGFVALVGAGVVLLAGKDDIQRFYRIHTM